MSSEFYIAEPCHESWSGMQPRKGGRFCAQCTKVVRDFTHSTPEQISRAYEEAGGNLCGRMLSSQLGPRREPEIRRSMLQSLARFALALWLCFGPLFAAAQKDGRPALGRDLTDAQKAELAALPASDPDSLHTALPVVDSLPDEDSSREVMFMGMDSGPDYHFEWSPVQLQDVKQKENICYEPVCFVMGNIGLIPGEWTLSGSPISPLPANGELPKMSSPQRVLRSLDGSREVVHRPGIHEPSPIINAGKRRRKKKHTGDAPE